MNIVFILPGSGRSGGIKSTVKAGNGLLDRGHRVQLFVYSGGFHPRDWLRKIWLNFRYAGNSDWVHTFKGKVIKFRDIRKCKFENGEIVIASCWWAARELRKVKNDNILKVHHLRGVLPDISEMETCFGENVPKIAIASYIGPVVEKTCGQKLTAVIPNGIDLKEFYPSLPENERDGVGTIFGVTYPKDPETILGVLDLLRKKCPEVPLRIFGGCRRWKRISRKIYHRLPSIEKIREIYSRSLVWVMASRSEGFAVPILEAMACGCAVVATDCGGPRDLIQDGENGFLVEVGNVRKIVDRIELLLQDKQLRLKFVKKGLETARKFSWDSSVDKLEKVLASLKTSE